MGGGYYYDDMFFVEDGFCWCCGGWVVCFFELFESWGLDIKFGNWVVLFDEVGGYVEVYGFEFDEGNRWFLVGYGGDVWFKV